MWRDPRAPLGAACCFFYMHCQTPRCHLIKRPRPRGSGPACGASERWLYHGYIMFISNTLHCLCNKGGLRADARDTALTWAPQAAEANLRMPRICVCTCTADQGHPFSARKSGCAGYAGPPRAFTSMRVAWLYTQSYVQLGLYFKSAKLNVHSTSQLNV